jgi:hypothetical protein
MALIFAGIGMMASGERDHSPDGSFVLVEWFVPMKSLGDFDGFKAPRHLEGRPPAAKPARSPETLRRAMTEGDPRQVLRDARAFAKSGAYAEALQKYLWFHDNALAHDQAWYGVRLSHALSEWAELGKIYPPARSAMESIRDASVKALREGSLDRDQFHDVESINAVLGHVDQTSALFVEFAQCHREFAGKCFRFALPALIHTGSFSIARSFISSPTDSLDRWVVQLSRDINDRELAATREAFIHIYVTDVKQLLSVLRGVGETEEAQRLTVRAVESIADPEICAEVSTQLGKESL